MIDRQTITAILTEAVQAPSGDNSQPWRFRVHENTIELFNLPDRDNPVFNFRQRGSLVAHGALLETLRLAAADYGLATAVQLFPNQGDQNHIATITLNDGALKDPLSAFIRQRATNRKSYNSQPLTDTQKQALINGVRDFPSVGITIVEDAEQRRMVGSAASTAERIMLGYKPLHDAFFGRVTWTTEQEQQDKSGLFVKTLELLPPQLAVFKLFRSWTVARFLGTLGLPKFIAADNAKKYAASPALIVITTTGISNQDFIVTGQVLQRLWLIATQLGLSVQPIAGALYLAQRLDEDQGTDFTEEQTLLIKEAKTAVAQVAPRGIPTMLFRIGDGGAPSARSSRQAPHIEFI